MIYLYGYFAIGVAVLMVIFAAHLVSRKHESDFASDMKDALYPERKTRKDRLLSTFVLPLLTALLVLAVWPVAFYMKGRELWEKEDPPISDDEERKFAVTKGDLLEKLSIPEVEARERIVDPMGAVPDVPFGHLNAAWLKFKTAMEPRDSISGFSARWSSGCGPEEILSGYAIVRGDRIGTHFLATRKRPNDD